eukprot:gene10635-14281_t
MNKFGPRFFWPTAWLPQIYNYKRNIPSALIEATHNNNNNNVEHGQHAFECVICYNPVEINNNSSNNSLDLFSNNRTYM